MTGEAPLSWRPETGRVWLETIPSDWAFEKFTRAVRIAEGQVDPTEEPYTNMVLVAPNHIESGTGRLISEETAADQAAISGKYLCRKGDLLYSKIRPELAKVVIAKRDCLCSADMYPLTALAPFETRYLFYFFLCHQFTDWVSLESSRVAMPKVNRETLAEIRLPLPPPSLQRAIADYLDTETARIDGLIAAKKNVITILADKRHSIISHAVTRGLDSIVETRVSDIPWLGSIPAHWEVTRLKFLLLGIEQGWSPQCENYPAGPDEWGVMKTGCVNGVTFDETENKRLPVDVNPRPEYEIRPGDFLLSRANTTSLVGSAALVRVVRPRLLLCDKLYRLKVDHARLNPEFLELFFNSPVGRQEFEKDASGASGSMQNISQDAVRNLWIGLPTLEEQAQIADVVRHRLVIVDEVAYSARRSIELLRERRDAVIAAAVTGQIYVGAT